MDKKILKKNTLCIFYNKELNHNIEGAITPIYTSTPYKYPNSEDLIVYPRHFNTLNQEVVAQKIARLENAEEGLILSSGMSAISTTLLTFLRPGDHAIFQKVLYGGTLKLIENDLKQFGIEISQINSGKVEDYKKEIKKNTKLIYVESPSNPLLQIIDLNAIGKLAKENNLLSIIDNTFASPINQNPIDFGLDIVLHSGTKYLNGHSDLTCGVILTSKEIMRKIIKSARVYGGNLDSIACYMLERGLKTLGIRVKEQNKNTLKLASYLNENSLVEKVYYPGLLNNHYHDIAKKQMSGFGGVLSFELKCNSNESKDAISKLKLFFQGASLGGVESLICFPAEVSHKGMTKSEREEVGISDKLVRVSVGIEDIDDLIEDFEQAFSSIKLKVTI